MLLALFLAFSSLKFSSALTQPMPGALSRLGAALVEVARRVLLRLAWFSPHLKWRSLTALIPEPDEKGDNQGMTQQCQFCSQVPQYEARHGPLAAM